MVLTAAACGGDGESDATSEIRETTTTELAISDLSGTWDNGSLVLRVNDEGDYEVGTPGPADPVRVLMVGFITRDGDQLNFVTGFSGECAGQTGVYEASITDDVLTLTLVDDPCESRVEQFELSFSKTD
jgi:hypothetical protein